MRLPFPPLLTSSILALAACSRSSESSSASSNANTNANAANSNAGASSASPSNGAPVTVGVAELVADYASDASRADAKYKSKRVRVSGVVLEGTTEGDHPGAILLAGAADADASAAGARCSFVESMSQRAAAFVKGTRLTIECDCTGMNKLVTLERCSFGGASAAPSSPSASAASAQDGKSARDVCAKLEAAGVAAKCRAEGTGDKARFDMPSAPGKSGLVVRLADDATFAKYEAGVAAQPPTSPLRPYVASARTRVVVHLASGAPADVEQKVKAALDAL